MTDRKCAVLTQVAARRAGERTVSDTRTGDPMTSPTHSLPASIREALDEYRARVVLAERELANDDRDADEYDRAVARRATARTALEAHIGALVARRDEAERERDAWRWLHWGHPEASWACVCGSGHGWAINYCDECGTWRPMKPDILAEVQAGATYDATLVAKHRAVFGTPPEDTTPHE